MLLSSQVVWHVNRVFLVRLASALPSLCLGRWDLLLLHLGHLDVLLLLHLLRVLLLHLLLHLHVCHHRWLVVLVVRGILAQWFSLSIVLIVHLWHDTQHLIALHLEVCLLGFLDLAVYSVDLELVRLYLGLIILQLSNHFLQLLAPFLQVLLVYYKFLGYFFATLLREYVL